MKQINLFQANDFSEKGMKRLLVHDSPYFKILNFNFLPGQSLPLHAHEVEGQVSLLILEGEGEYLAGQGQAMPVVPGDMVICDIAESHGIRARSPMRVLVTIAPPI